MLKPKHRKEELDNRLSASQDSLLYDSDVTNGLRRASNHTGPVAASSGIRDNYIRGTVGSFLKAKLRAGSTLSVVSAYFTIYAFEALQEQLKTIDRYKFLTPISSLGYRIPNPMTIERSWDLPTCLTNLASGNSTLVTQQYSPTKIERSISQSWFMTRCGDSR